MCAMKCFKRGTSDNGPCNLACTLKQGSASKPSCTAANRGSTASSVPLDDVTDLSNRTLNESISAGVSHIEAEKQAYVKYL